MSLLQLLNIKKDFGRLSLLNDLSLSVSDGEFISVLGASGSGKTTLLKIIAGLESFQSGTLRWKNSEIAPDISYVFQEPELLPWRNVFKNIQLPLELKKQTINKDDIYKTLEWLGLESFAEYMPHQLSGGMKMRVSLARAMITRPKLLLLDEPFAALDELTREKLDLDLRRLWKDQKLTCIFVTHSVNEAVYLSNSIMVLTKTERATVHDNVKLSEDRPLSIRLTSDFIQEVERFSKILRGLS